jgi:hypothetical protein
MNFKNPYRSRPVSIVHFLVVCLLGFTSMVSAAQVSVQATLGHGKISLGQATQLDVIVNGAPDTPSPKLPKVDGLDISYMGHSFSIQYVNGVMSSSHTHSYQVVALREGTFTISPIQVSTGGNSYQASPLTLTVGPGNSSSVTPSPPVITAPGVPSRPATSNPRSSLQRGELAELRVILPNRDIYVGELVPVDLKLYVREEVTPQGVSPPAVSSAFTITKVTNENDRSRDLINGVLYQVATWHPAISAVKSGDQPLSVAMDCTVLVPVRSRNFHDALFDDFFGGVPAQPKTIPLKSPPIQVNVKELPSDGKPPSFKGAVGHFQLVASASSTQISVGDPITLKYSVEGSGNFDRVRDLEIARTPDLKTYPPTMKFESNDPNEFEGTKIFEQVIVPQNSDVKEIPSITFSFFDPELKTYVVRNTDPIPIHVRPGANVQPLPPPPPVLASSSPMKSGPVELLPNKIELGSTQDLGVIVLRPGFIVLQSIPLCFMAFALVYSRRKNRLENDPLFARSVVADQAMRKHLLSLEQAERQLNAPEFFQAARRLLQEALGKRWNTPSESITFSEIESRLAHDAQLSAHLRRFFETADAVAYSGQAYSSEALHGWKQSVLDMAKQIQKGEKLK